jgi:hypothetical protein
MFGPLLGLDVVGDGDFGPISVEQDFEVRAEQCFIVRKGD